MSNLQRVVISSTKKNNKIIKQQAVYKSKGFSRTRHEKVLEDDEGNIKIISKVKKSNKFKKVYK
jgi:hypothetical protein